MQPEQQGCKHLIASEQQKGEIEHKPLKAKQAKNLDEALQVDYQEVGRTCCRGGDCRGSLQGQ